MKDYFLKKSSHAKNEQVITNTGRWKKNLFLQIQTWNNILDVFSDPNPQWKTTCWIRIRIRINWKWIHNPHQDQQFEYG